jgi:hypothetical protein
MFKLNGLDHRTRVAGVFQIKPKVESREYGTTNQMVCPDDLLGLEQM